MKKKLQKKKKSFGFKIQPRLVLRCFCVQLNVDCFRASVALLYIENNSVILAQDSSFLEACLMDKILFPIISSNKSEASLGIEKFYFAFHFV